MKIGIVIAAGKKNDAMLNNLKGLGLNFYFQCLKSTRNDHLAEGFMDSDMAIAIVSDCVYKDFRGELIKLNRTRLALCFVIGDCSDIKKDLPNARFIKIDDQPYVENIGKTIFHLVSSMLQASLRNISPEEYDEILQFENKMELETGNDEIENRGNFFSSQIKKSSWYNDKRIPLHVCFSIVGNVTLQDIASIADTISEKCNGEVPLFSVSFGTKDNKNNCSLLIIASYSKKLCV